MTYAEFINSIIEKRGKWGLNGEYWEGHHIVPKCLGGKGNSRCKHSNIIRLYPQEHYLAHKLLAEENPNNSKILRAWSCISHVWNEKRLTNIFITAEEYAEMKVKTNKAFKWFTNDKEEIRGLECPLEPGWHPGRKASIKDSSKAFEHKGLKGERNGMYGKKHSAESNWERYKKCSSYHWYYKDNKEIYSNQDLTVEGFTKGRLHTKRWFNNGKEEVLSSEKPDESFVKGRLKKARSKSSTFIVLYKYIDEEKHVKLISKNRKPDNFIRDGWEVKDGE